MCFRSLFTQTAPRDMGNEKKLHRNRGDRENAY